MQIDKATDNAIRNEMENFQQAVVSFVGPWLDAADRFNGMAYEGKPITKDDVEWLRDFLNDLMDEAGSLESELSGPRIELDALFCELENDEVEA